MPVPLHVNPNSCSADNILIQLEKAIISSTLRYRKRQERRQCEPKKTIKFGKNRDFRCLFKLKPSFSHTSLVMASQSLPFESNNNCFHLKLSTCPPKQIMANIEIKWLKSFRIAVIGNYVPAPMAGYLLKSLGAEVIKIESGKGDFLRMTGNQLLSNGATMSGMFHALNKGFKSLHLAYQSPEGAKILRELLQNVDVLFDGSKPGRLEKYMGIRPDSISKDLIYIPISAYGQVGPLAKLGGHDNNALALAGNLSYTNRKEDGGPAVFSSPIADFFAGQSAAFAALAALMARQQGQLNENQIDASMLHSSFFLNFLEIADQNFGKEKAPKPDQHWINGGMPNYTNYTCKDGKYVFLGAMELHLFKRFIESTGQNVLLDIIDQPAQLTKRLKALFMQKEQAEWVAIGAEVDVCMSPVNDLNSAIAAPQIQALGLAQPADDGSLKPSFPLGFGPKSLQPEIKDKAPALGQHSAEILRAYTGLSHEAIQELTKEKVIGLGNE